MAFDLLNREKHYSAILEELSDEAKDFYNELGEDTCQGLAEEESDRLADSHVETMREYSHQSDTSQWGDYDDMLKAMDEETISDEDKAKVQQWVEDWFWTAYGTRWTRYNFADTLGQFAYEAEQDRNQE